MQNETKKAVIYCRTACAEQGDTHGAIIQQETECRLYAAKHGYEVVQAFHDSGISGMTLNRPALRLMLVALLASSEPYAVITTGMERLGRDISDFASLCRILGGLNSELLFTEDDNAGRTA